MRNMAKLLIVLMPVLTLAQNVDMYISLLHEGNTAGVREQLPEPVSYTHLTLPTILLV